MKLQLRMMSITARLSLIAAVAFAGLLFSVYSHLRQIHDEVYNGRLDKIRSVVQSAHAIIGYYARLADEGEMTKEAAQEAAAKALSAVRYDGDEYVFVVDMTRHAIMNGAHPEMKGKDQTNFKDASGKYFVREMVAVAKDKGEGKVDYVFPKFHSTVPQPKLSYVKAFIPWGWVVGTGIYVDDVQRVVRREMIKQTAVVVALMALMGLCCLVIGRAISGPVRSLTTVMRRLADGDLSVEVVRDQGSDIGEMQKAVQVFKDNAIEMRHLAAEHDRAAERAAIERRQMMLRLADDLERSVAQVIDGLSEAARDMHGTAETMAATASAASRQSETMSVASVEASTSVGTVAAATEQLHSSISEITRQVNQAAKISRGAVDAAHQTNETVGGLADAAGKIGAVVRLIEDIAGQTNLLALNATIEAARAGEAGKGFAVVAGEVKDLASQTGRATGEIASQVASVQTATDEAVAAIRAISATIAEISEIGAAIASAVEQQGAATQEISRNTQLAAKGTDTVSRAVGDMNATAADTGRSAESLLAEAESLNHQVAALQQAVGQFLAGIRAA